MISRFLLVRFAWAIFPMLEMFLSFSHQRRLRIQVETEDGSVQEQIVTRKGDDLDRLTARSSRLQDVSKKRKWVDLESNNDGLDSTNLNCLSSDNSLPQSPTDFSKSLKIRCKYCGLIRCVDPEACRIRALVAKEVKRQASNRSPIALLRLQCRRRRVCIRKLGRARI
jgi:hypothetical protein